MIEAVSRSVGIPVVASGGAGNPSHLVDAFHAGADAALAASIFHYNEYSIPTTKRFLSDRGIPVRLLYRYSFFLTPVRSDHGRRRQ